MPSVSTQQNRYIRWRASQGDAWAKKWLAEQQGIPVPNVKYVRKKKGRRKA